MKHLLFKSLTLFLSIPMLNSIAFGLGSIFHTPYQATITQDQYTDYSNSMLFLILASALTIGMLEFLFERKGLSNRNTNLLYVTSFVIIAIVTWDQFLFRPFEHSLTFLSICSVVLTRMIWNQTLRSKLGVQEHSNLT